MSSTGFNIEEIDTFKKYKGYEGCYIIVSDIRHKYFNDDIYNTYIDLDDALYIMDSLELWDGYMIGYVTDNGYPSFYIDL